MNARVSEKMLCPVCQKEGKRILMHFSSDSRPPRWDCPECFFGFYDSVSFAQVAELAETYAKTIGGNK